MIKPIKMLPARERVAAELRKAILSGNFQAGQELAQDKIAEMLGVSRMPVREAIHILASEGLIEVCPNRSAVVREVPTNFILEHFEVRILLECEAAARACMRFENLDEILSIHEEHRIAIETNDIEQVQATNQSFHIMIWDAADNIKMKAFLTQLWNGLSINMVNKKIDHVHQEHEAIVQAFCDRDPEAVRRAMKKHLERSMQDIIDSQKIKKK